MNRYRMGLTIIELIALDTQGKLKREDKERTRKFARQMASSFFGSYFLHPPGVIHRIDTVDDLGNVIRTNDLSHGRHRSKRIRTRRD